MTGTERNVAFWEAIPIGRITFSLLDQKIFRAQQDRERSILMPLNRWT